MHQEACFCGEIVEVLPVAHPRLAAFEEMKDAGWIEGEIDRPRVCYCVNSDTVERFQNCCSLLTQNRTRKMETKESIRATVRDRMAKWLRAATAAADRLLFTCRIDGRYRGTNRYKKEDLAQIPSLQSRAGMRRAARVRAGQTGRGRSRFGSGAGFDCFLAARAVGDAGRVIGVDMTPEMLEKARENAKTAGARNVGFVSARSSTCRSQITRGSDHLNCVINLSPEKEQVFAEAFRVLKPGDACWSRIGLARELSPRLKSSVEAYVGCIPEPRARKSIWR